MISLVGSSLALFVMLLVGLELGRWWRGRRGSSESASVDSAAAEGVVFAVLGLLIAFTFTSSAARFDERRKLIVDQANAIGTAWLRTDLVGESDRQPIRRCMKEWVRIYLAEPRLTTETDPAALQEKIQKLQQLQNEAWQAAVQAVDRLAKPQWANLILPPINDWIDLSSTRIEMTNRGLPPLVMPTLIILAFAGAVLAGFNMARRANRSVLHMLLFAAAIAFTMYVIMDMNHPRSGLIRIDATDDAMRQLYASMTGGAKD